MAAYWGGTTGMAGYGLAHWLALIVAVGLVLYPLGRILGRMGFSPVWSLLALFPLLNIVGLWIVAFMEWPKPDRGTT